MRHFWNILQQRVSGFRCGCLIAGTLMTMLASTWILSWCHELCIWCSRSCETLSGGLVPRFYNGLSSWRGWLLASPMLCVRFGNCVQYVFLQRNRRISLRSMQHVARSANCFWLVSGTLPQLDYVLCSCMPFAPTCFTCGPVIRKK